METNRKQRKRDEYLLPEDACCHAVSCAKMLCTGVQPDKLRGLDTAEGCGGGASGRCECRERRNKMLVDGEEYHITHAENASYIMGVPDDEDYTAGEELRADDGNGLEEYVEFVANRTGYTGKRTAQEVLAHADVTPVEGRFACALKLLLDTNYQDYTVNGLWLLARRPVAQARVSWTYTDCKRWVHRTSDVFMDLAEGWNRMPLVGADAQLMLGSRFGMGVVELYVEGPDVFAYEAVAMRCRTDPDSDGRGRPYDGYYDTDHRHTKTCESFRHAFAAHSEPLGPLEEDEPSEMCAHHEPPTATMPPPLTATE